MPTIANEYKEMYGNKEPFGNANLSPNNLLKKIVPNQEFNNNVTRNYNKNLNNPITEDISKPSQFPYLLIFILLLFLGIGIFIYFNRDKIYNFYKERVNPTKEEPPQEDVLPEKPISKKKSDNEIKDIPEKNIKEINKEEREKNKKIKNGGVNELNKKLNDNYSPEQIVRENSYCYIGYENGQRECTNVFDGDICMSGEIFPKMDICINPRLRP
jgi:hypothetical protein